MSLWRRIGRQAKSFGRALAGWFRPGKKAAQQRDVAFTMAVIALAAKMAGADGHVAEEERAVFQRLFAVPPGERPNVERLFRLAAATTAGFEPYAQQIARLFHDEPQVLEDVLDALFHIAAADGVMHPAEMALLEEAGRIFRLGPRFRCIRARHMQHPEDAPYEVLGVDPCASPEAVKSAYRRLVRENHPDRLVARGLPRAAQKLAHERMAAINAAYEEIRRQRRDEAPVELAAS